MAGPKIEPQASLPNFPATIKLSQPASRHESRIAQRTRHHQRIAPSFFSFTLISPTRRHNEQVRLHPSIRILVLSPPVVRKFGILIMDFFGYSFGLNASEQRVLEERLAKRQMQDFMGVSSAFPSRYPCP